MAFITCNYGSTMMNKYMGLNVILPADDELAIKDSEGKYAVLYLLHGYTDDYTKWQRLTSVERYANDLGIAIVMPDGGKSFYTDMEHGDPYFSYITEEVPTLAQQWFPLSKDPKFNFIAGLSMGGYGAMKIGLTYPERFSIVGSFSGVVAMAESVNAKVPEDAEDWMVRLNRDLPLVFGYDTDITGTKEDLFYLAEKLAEDRLKEPGKNSEIDYYFSCGTEDFLYESNLYFKGHLEKLGIPFTFSERPGVHSWDFWDVEVLKLMNMIVDKLKGSTT